MKCETCGARLTSFSSTDSCKGYDFRSDGGEYHRHFQPVMETRACENSHVTTEVRKWGQE